MKKTLAILLALVLICSLVACNKTVDNNNSNNNNNSAPPASVPPVTSTTPPSGNQPAPPPTQPGIATEKPPEGAKLRDHITIMNDGPATPVIDAFSTAGNGAQCGWIYTMITDRLFMYNEQTTEFDPMLATKWETKDNQNYRFWLRDDVTFHNGEHFTAKDVKWTCEIARNYPGSQANNRWGYVAEAKVIDDYTIDLILDKPNAGFLMQLSSPPMGIYNEKAYKEQPDTWTWIGTGPYKVVGFSANEYADLEMFPDCWDKCAQTKMVSFRFIPEESVRPVMMLNDSFQFSLGILADDLDVFDKDPNFKLLPRRLNSPISLGFNMDDPITGDLNFRLAVIHALDGDEIGLVGEGARGYAPKTDGAVWGWTVPFRNWDIPAPKRDLNLAKEYLAKSKWDGKPVEIAAMPGGLGRAAETIQAQLQAIGLPIELKIMDQPSLFAYCAFGNNQCQMYVFPAIFDLCPFMGTRSNYAPGAMNFTGYKNPRVIELIEAAEKTADTELQRKYFYEIQEIACTDWPQFGMFWKEFIDVAYANVFGYVMSNTSPNHNFRAIYQLLD